MVTVVMNEQMRRDGWNEKSEKKNDWDTEAGGMKQEVEGHLLIL